MEGGKAEHDYNEFDMLLKEIPDLSSGKSQSSGSMPAQSSPSDPFTNFYHTPQAVKLGTNAALYRGFALHRPMCVNSSNGPLNQKLQSNGNFDGGKANVSNDYRMENANRDDSNLPDGQSLASAFAELSFKDGVVVAPEHKGLPNSAFLIEGQHPNILKRPLSCFNSNTHNSVNLINPVSEAYPSLPSTNDLHNLNVETNGQESEKFVQLDVRELIKPKTGSYRPVGIFSSDSVEQQQNLPVYSRALPLTPGLHAIQVHPSVPVPGIEFPFSAFQQQYYLDAQSSPYMHPQHLSSSHMPWRHMEDEKYSSMNQQYFYLPQLHNQGSEVHDPSQLRIDPANGSGTRNMRPPYFNIPMSHQIKQVHPDTYWNSKAGQTVVGSGICLHYAQGYCGRGESCPFAHVQRQTSANGLIPPSAALSAKDFQGIQVFDSDVKQNLPRNFFTRSLRVIRPCSTGDRVSQSHANSNARLFSNGVFQLDGQSFRGSSPESADFEHSLKSHQQNYNSVDEAVGRIYFMAKDQHGCRFLQRKLIEGTLEDVHKIFVEIICHIPELMTDPFGNYLIQKLLEVCGEDQRMQILHVISRTEGDLTSISCDMHGTRSVQKVIETVKTQEQYFILVTLLKPGIVILMKDVNGNHVAQRCLQYLSPEYTEFLFEAATIHCVELATDRHGCCVLQKSLRYSDGKQRRCLISEITSNALILSQDPFGNYVVQFIIELKVPWATENVLKELEGNYGYLAMQKYSSNVVEKCLKLAGEEGRVRIIQELISNSRLGQILQDPFGNYVIQTALAESKGALHSAIVEAIRPHVPGIRSSPYGKKILSTNNLKK